MFSVKVNGVTYTNLISGFVSRSVSAFTGAFEATFSATNLSDFPIKIQDNIVFLIDNNPILTGIIDTLNYGTSLIDVSGHDKTIDVFRSSIKGPFSLTPGEGQITLKSIIENLLDINKIPIKVIDNVNPKPFKFGDSIDGEVGENLFEIIDKYCKKRQVFASTDELGNIILTRGSVDTYKGKLIYFDTENRSQTRLNNILSPKLSAGFSERYNTYEILSQFNFGSVDEFGGSVSSIEGVQQSGAATDIVIRSTKHLAIPSDTSNDNQTSETRAVWQANIQRSRSSNYSCMVQGFFSDKNKNELLKPNVLIYVIDTKRDIDGFLLIDSVEYSTSAPPDGIGNVTRLNLVTKDAYTLNANPSVQQSRTNKFGVDI